MLSSKSKNLFVIGVLLACEMVLANYYKPDFFPIGLTGLNYTGSGQVDNCPYSNVDIEPRWTWNTGTNSEKALIEALGVNCIGCQDSHSRYIGSLDTSECWNRNNYLYRVCIPSFADDGDSTNPEHIYIIIFRDISDILDSLPDSLSDSLDLDD